MDVFKLTSIWLIAHFLSIDWLVLSINIFAVCMIFFWSFGFMYILFLIGWSFIIIEFIFLSLCFVIGINSLNFQIPIAFLRSFRTYADEIASYYQNDYVSKTESFVPPFIFGYRKYFFSRIIGWKGTWASFLKQYRRRIKSSIFEWGYTSRIPSWHFYVIRGGLRVKILIPNNFRRVSESTYNCPTWFYGFPIYIRRIGFQDSEWDAYNYQPFLEKAHRRLYVLYREVERPRTRNLYLSSWVEKWAPSIDPAYRRVGHYNFVSNRNSPYSYFKFSRYFLNSSKVATYRHPPHLGMEQSILYQDIETHETLDRNVIPVFNRFLHQGRTSYESRVAMDRYVAGVGQHYLINKEAVKKKAFMIRYSYYAMDPSRNYNENYNYFRFSLLHWYHIVNEFFSLVFESLYVYSVEVGVFKEFISIKNINLSWDILNGLDVYEFFEFNLFNSVLVYFVCICGYFIINVIIFQIITFIIKIMRRLLLFVIKFDLKKKMFKISKIWQSLFKHIQYYFEYGYSWIICNSTVLVFKFQDYLDYLEIRRFYLWSSISSAYTIRGYPHKSSRDLLSSPHLWINTIPFTKLQLKRDVFLPVRGIAWDRGVDVNALELHLVQSEHYLSVSTLSNKTDFQTYVLDQYPKRPRFYKLKYQDANFGPGFTAWSNYIYSGKFILGLFYMLSFSFLFWLFLILELISLKAYLLSFQLIDSYPVINPLIRCFSKCCIVLFRVSLNLMFPIIYITYIWVVFIYIIFLSFGEFGLLFYLWSAKYVYILGFGVYRHIGDFRSYLIFVIFSKFRISYWFSCGKLHILNILISYGTKLNKFLFRHPWILSPFFIFIHSLRLIIMLSLVFKFVIYFNLLTPFLWFINYVVLVFICLSYDGLMGPACFSVISIFGVLILFPQLTKFVAINLEVFYGDPGIATTIEDRAMVMGMSTRFYKALGEERISRRLNKWRLARRVLAVKYMNQEETAGTDVRKARDLGYKISSVPNFQNMRLKLLIQYFQTARESVLITPDFASHNTRLDLDSSTKIDEEFTRFAYMNLEPQFRSDEFRFCQSNLTRLYYLVSRNLKTSMGLSSRIIFCCLPIYNKKISVQLKNNYSSKSCYSGFIFSNSYNCLYMLRISEFSKIFRNDWFFFRSSAQFAPREILTPFNELPKLVRECLNQFVNARFVPIWDSSNISVSNKWVYKSLENSKSKTDLDVQNFFNFNYKGLDEKFQLSLYEIIDQSNKNSYVSVSTYTQILYDLYWIFQLNTSIFLTYSFEIKFYFSTITNPIYFSNWLFKNLVLDSINYPVYQDDMGSLFTHAFLLPIYVSNASIVVRFDEFYEILTKLVKFGNKSYYDYLLHQVENKCNNQIGNVILFDAKTFSKEFLGWTQKLILGSAGRDRDVINQAIVEALYWDLRIISKDALGDFQALNLNYARQSFFSTYLYSKTSIGFQRYVVRGKEKLGNLFRDIINLLKHLTVIEIHEDVISRTVPEIDNPFDTFAGYYRTKEKFVARLRSVFRLFPSSHSSEIFELYSFFIAGSYIYAAYYIWPFEMRMFLTSPDPNLRPKPNEEIYNIFMDFVVWILTWAVSWFLTLIYNTLSIVHTHKNLLNIHTYIYIYIYMYVYFFV